MKLIIIGAGFGGLRLARKLSNKTGFDITIIDKFNYHQFQPLFYQVATAGLDASNISFPLRKVFHKSKNVRFRMAEVETINTENKTVKTNIGDFEYDALVIATGVRFSLLTNRSTTRCRKLESFPPKPRPSRLPLRYRNLSMEPTRLQPRSHFMRR